MPKNGFFFLFMAPVTPKAKNVKDPGRSQKRNSTKLLPPQEAIATCVTRAPEAERPVRRSPAHLGFPGRKFTKQDFRQLPGAPGCG